MEAAAAPALLALVAVGYAALTLSYTLVWRHLIVFDIFAVAANNDFSSPVPEVREAQICFVRDLIRMTADLGAPTLRVFLAWWGVTRHPQLATYDIAEGYWPIVHEKFTTEEIWGWCREALVECSRYAGDARLHHPLPAPAHPHLTPAPA